MIALERIALIAVLQLCLWANLRTRWLSKRIDARLSKIEAEQSL